MKVIKPILLILCVCAFASCNTKNRMHVHDTVVGTPTYSDSVLYKEAKIAKEGSLHHLYWR